MASTYTQLSATSQTVKAELANHQSNLDKVKAQFGIISQSLTAMQSTYSSWATEVDALAAANPSDAAVIALKAERDRMVAEFNQSKTRADALTAAVNGV